MSFNATRTNVIKHELGHWLVARHVGFPAAEIEITIHKRLVAHGRYQHYQHGSVQLYPAPVVGNVEELKDYLEKRFQVLYAGTAAQIEGQELDGDQTGEVMRLDAADDLRIIRELAPLLRGIIYGAEVDRQTSEQQCFEMLESCWTKVSHLVSELSPKLNLMASRMAEKITVPNMLYTFSLDELIRLEEQFVE